MLSRLQKYILREIQWGRTTHPTSFVCFYDRQREKPKKEDQQSSVIRSLERLVDQGLIIAYGRKTKEKFFIERVRLTPKGRSQVKTLFTQTQLPLPTKRKRHGSSKKS